MDLPLGKLRLRPSGSAGGHNGIKSMISHLGTQDFPRLRLGIGRANKTGDGASVTNHVLGGFSSAETKLLPDILQLATTTVDSILNDGLDKAMSLYNSQSVG
jgi:PTH1 family peptidyl-tRNA hydrolase